MTTFYRDFAATGEVLGCSTDSSPEAWAAALGPRFADDRVKKRLRRDYGLIEVNFFRVDGVWGCFSVSVQAHRLGWGEEAAVPEPLVAAYGPFPARVAAADLLAELEAAGSPAARVPGREIFHVPSSNVHLYLAEQGADSGQSGSVLRKGDVWSLIKSPVPVLPPENQNP
ncbi:MAG TPA: hypothetical protein VGX23_09545 [Actinocrinis sp.]|nr:hypothetical protein [Actinocrinis sp.]